LLKGEAKGDFPLLAERECKKKYPDGQVENNRFCKVFATNFSRKTRDRFEVTRYTTLLAEI